MKNISDLEQNVYIYIYIICKNIYINIYLYCLCLLRFMVCLHKCQGTEMQAARQPTLRATERQVALNLVIFSSLSEFLAYRLMAALDTVPSVQGHDSTCPTLHEFMEAAVIAKNCQLCRCLYMVGIPMGFLRLIIPKINPTSK